MTRKTYCGNLLWQSGLTLLAFRRVRPFKPFTVGVRAAPTEWLTLHASAYRNEIDDRFDLDAAGQYHNASDLKATGFELTARATPTDDLALFAGATYTIAETHPVSRLTEATGVVGASWRFLKYLHLDADVEYSSSMYAYTVRSADPADLAKVPCFWTANIRLACDLKAFSPLDGEVYVAAENAFNRHYEYFPGYEMPGTMVYIGCKLKF